MIQTSRTIPADTSCRCNFESALMTLNGIYSVCAQYDVSAAIYSRTPVARTLMTRLPRLFRTRS